MIKKINIALIFIIPIFWVACDEDDDSVYEFNILVEYLEENDRDWVNYMSTTSGWIKSENSINYDEYLVLDLRSEADFVTTPNPIPNAVNATLGNMFDKISTSKKLQETNKILVTCYSGQTASFAHMLLRMKGYEAYSMKWGMSTHHESIDKWSGNTSDKNATDLVNTPSPALPTFDFPELNTDEETGEAILDKRIAVAIAAWGNGLLINADSVIGNASAFNIMSYWPEADYLNYGHIAGAYQLPTLTLKKEGNLSVFDDKGTNILYCYTGQTAAAAIAYLTVLGYDAKSIEFGFNNMNWSELTGHKWLKCPSCRKGNSDQLLISKVDDEIF